MPNRYKVLFVDDEARVLRSLKSLFRREYDVYTASSGQSALELLENQKIDVIVSDQRMPGMLGHELLAQVKQSYPQMMRLLLTGYMDKDAIIKTINDGEIYRFLNKPWQVDDIKQTIAEAASLSQITVTVEQGNHQLSTKVDTRPAQKPTLATTPTNVSPLNSGGIATAGLTSANVTTTTVTTTNGAATNTAVNNATRTKDAVLLMDPDQTIRNQIRRLSKEQGFRVYGIQGFESALRTLAIRPNIGVAIIGMPIESRETIEAINVFKQKRPDLSIIVLTDMTDAQVAVDLINQGQVFRYLEKPLKHSLFGVAIHSAMSRHRLIKGNETVQGRYRSKTIARVESKGIQRLMSLFKLKVA